jgi:hypothetical protein
MIITRTSPTGSSRFLHRPVTNAISCIFVACLTFQLACKSDSGSSASSSVSASQASKSADSISTLLPKDTGAFLRIKLSDEPTRLTLARNLSSMLKAEISQEVASLPPDQRAMAEASKKNLEDFKKIAVPIIDAGLLPQIKEDGSLDPGMASELLAFVSWKGDSEPVPGILVQSTAPAQSVLTRVKSNLAKNQVKITDTDVGFSFDSAETKVFLSGKDNMISVSKTEAQAKEFLNTVGSPSDLLERLVKNVPDYARKPVIGYADFASLTGLGEEVKNLGLDYSAVEFEHEAGILHTAASVHFDVKNSPIKTYLDQLLASGVSDSVTLSDRLALMINVSSVAINTMKVEIAKMPELKELEPVLPLLAALGSLKAGIVEAGESNPFPELFLASSTEKSDALLKTTESMLADNLGPLLGGLQWQSKELGKTPIKYILSPFGIGVFLGSASNQVVLASGEDGIRSLLEEKQSTTASQQKLTEKLQKVPGFLLAYYLHGEKLAQIVKELMQAVAPFTGGQASVDPQLFEQLQEQGETLATISPLKDGLAFNSWAIAK